MSEEVKAAARETLSKWLNKTMKVKITDGRTLIGSFLCTDKDSNLILGACHEYVNLDNPNSEKYNEARSIGLSMIPGHHVVSIHVDEPSVI